MAPDWLDPQHLRQEEQDDEDSLLLSDFPTAAGPPALPRSTPAPEEAEEFEFLAADAAQGNADMCAADEVFFRGQLLPLASRSESLERSSSCGLTCSSGSMSRSQSTDSAASAGSLRRASIYYAHPSPRPGAVAPGRTSTARRRQRSSSGGSAGLFGVARAPEIEVGELRRRRRKGSAERKEKMGLRWLLGEKFSCSCSVGEVREPAKKVEGGERPSASSSSSSTSSRWSRRTFQWLEELGTGTVKDHCLA